MFTTRRLRSGTLRDHVTDLEVAAHERNHAEAFGVLGVYERKAVHARRVAWEPPEVEGHHG
jgi:hypothetical protein